jgi:hypothetical protein
MHAHRRDKQSPYPYAPEGIAGTAISQRVVKTIIGTTIGNWERANISLTYMIVHMNDHVNSKTSIARLKGFVNQILTTQED